MTTQFPGLVCPLPYSPLWFCSTGQLQRRPGIGASSATGDAAKQRRPHQAVRAWRPDPGHPHKGDYHDGDARQGRGHGQARAEGPGGGKPVRSRTYEITFLGQVGTTLRAEFDDCEVTIGPGTTTVRTELPDRGALSGLLERINSLGLDIIDVSLLTPPLRR